MTSDTRSCFLPGDSTEQGPERAIAGAGAGSVASAPDVTALVSGGGGGAQGAPPLEVPGWPANRAKPSDLLTSAQAKRGRSIVWSTCECCDHTLADQPH